MVERWNRTMKEKMFKYFTSNNTRRYVDVINEMVDTYNNGRHSPIKMAPVAASDKKNERVVWFNLYGNEPAMDIKFKFAVGDRVRITKKKGIFDKGFMPRWTEEIFKVLQVQYTDPPTYKITDNNGEEIQGTFYEEELQKTNQEIFRIEKIVGRKGNKSLVKWVGYPESFNSWVENSELLAV